jgi:hypothetical protein
MKARRFRFLAVGLALAASAVPGCLEPDPDSAEGRLLYAGREIEQVRFQTIEDEPWLTFDVPKATAMEGLGRRVDVHLVNWANGRDRLVIADRSDRPEWAPTADARGIRFYMTGERLAPVGGTGSATVPVGTLTRVSFLQGVVETIPDVLGFSLDGSRRRFVYRRYVPGAVFPDLYLRDLDGRERNLGAVSGAVQFFGGPEGPLYFVAGEDHVLTRSPGFEGEPEPIRARVSRMLLRQDERYAILSVSEMGMVRTLVRNLQTGEEKPLPAANPCCWLGLSGDTFVFSESARTGAPAKLHYFDLVKHEDTALTMPEGLADVSAIIPRPSGEGHALFMDSQRRVAVFRPAEEPQIRLTDLRPAAPQFAPDGNHLVYLEPEPPPPGLVMAPPAGKLMVQDADFRDPPRVLSPFGASVPLSPPGYFFTGGGQHTIVFWAHYGRSASDLYFGNHQTGESLPVAFGISQVTVTQRHVIGIVRVSLQDLTGDLVQKDLTTGEEHVLAGRVLDMTIQGPRIAYVVRNRLPSARDGLWAAMLK